MSRDGGENVKALDKLVSQPAERIARLDAAASERNVIRTDAVSNSFDNRPTWDNWSNNR